MHTPFAKSLAVVLAAGLSTAAGVASGADAAPGLSSKDRQFMTKAAQAGHAEVAAGKLAESKASADDVKKFGQRMVQDHGSAGDTLKQLAQAKGVTLPSEPDSAHRKLGKKLESARADEFDRLYVSEAGVKDHKAAVALFTDEAKNGKDADVKSFAEKTLPTIKEHYQMAQDLARTAGKKR